MAYLDLAAFANLSVMPIEAIDAMGDTWSHKFFNWIKS